MALWENVGHGCILSWESDEGRCRNHVWLLSCLQNVILKIVQSSRRRDAKGNGN